MNSTYSEISLKAIERFKMARYVVISPNPEEDAAVHMENWAKCSGLLNWPQYTPKKIGWNFPFVTEEQNNKYGLRGYVAAYIIPEDFIPLCGGAELVYRKTEQYATITITNPFINAFESIPGAYEEIARFIAEHGYQMQKYTNQTCFEFEEVYERDGQTYMDIYVPICSK